MSSFRLRLSLLSLLLAAMLVVPVCAWPAAAQEQEQEQEQEQDRRTIVMKKNDKNGDGRISREEWGGAAKMFDRLDVDKDGFLTFDELGARFAAGGQFNQGNIIALKMLDDATRAGFLRRFGSIKDSEARGQVESNLIPVYPENAACPRIDHIFGEKWQGPQDSKHSGADIPAAWDEPIHAMADGEVVAKFLGKRNYRGLQLVLRHTPEQTGLPVYVYTLYSHFREMPKLEIGQKVRQGDYLGPNGKTGVPGKKREPHLHLSVYISTSPRYVLLDESLIPEHGYFIDPVALFRGKLPLETHAVRALPEGEKRVPIAYKLKSGEAFPAGARIIWPYLCPPK